MKNIGLIGWNGKQNLGDDAMTAVIIRYILNHVDLPENGLKFCLLADKSTLAKYTDSPHTFDAFSYYNLSQNIPYLRRYVNPVIFDHRLAQVSPILLIGGGSIFHSVAHSQRLQRAIRSTRSSHKRSFVAALGVSLGPFKDSSEELACKQTLDNLDFIAVRDQRSWDILNHLKVEIPCIRSVDIALLLPELLKDSIEERQTSISSIGIALRSGYADEDFLEKIAGSLNSIQGKDNLVSLELFNFSKVDVVVSEKLKQKLIYPARVIFHDYMNSPEDMYRALSRCSVVLSSRLHSAVIAYSVGTPFFLLSYHQKCLDFANEVGLDPLSIFSVRDLSEPDLTDQVLHLLSGSKQFTARKPVRELRLEARKSFQFLNMQGFQDALK